MSKTGGFMKGALLGALLGLAGGVLFAPKKGDEIRRELKLKLDEYGKKATEKAAEFSKEGQSLEATIESVGSKLMTNMQQVSQNAKQIAEKFSQVMPLNKPESVEAGKPEVRKRKFFKGIS